MLLPRCSYVKASRTACTQLLSAVYAGRKPREPDKRIVEGDSKWVMEVVVGVVAVRGVAGKAGKSGHEQPGLGDSYSAPPQQPTCTDTAGIN